MKSWQIVAIGLIVLSLVYWPAVVFIMVAAVVAIPLILIYRAARRN